MNFNSGVVRDGWTRPDDESGEDVDDLPTCPWCMKPNQTVDQIRECSGFKPSGMPPNETGHPYGCGCSECMAEYQRLK